MSAKKSSPTQSPVRDKEFEVKYRMFEKLSQKGFLQSLQQQMRRAIAQELNDSTQPTNSRNGMIEDKPNEEKQVEEVYEKESDPLEKVSAIANWEKQIRYELEIDREIQLRELERQRERLKSESRKLDQRDKCLRIELDARERRLRLREEELQTNIEDMNQKLSEITAKEQTIDSIVGEKIKFEVKDEMERLRKKFNQLEEKEISLNKREEKVKEVEQRLHEQVKIVKEKIDNKRQQEIELAKSRKDLEIIKKENEVLKQRIEAMEDYQLIKFENKSLKNELNAIKETLKTKITEFEFEREKWDKNVKQSDEKALNYKIDLRRRDQELLLLKQKHQGDLDQYDNQMEQLRVQIKQSKIAIQQLQQKNHLLSKQIIDENVSQKIIESKETLNNNMTQMDGQKGCHICDHNIKTMEESSLDFLISQKCISDAKTKAFEDNNPSLSCDNNNEEKILKRDKQNSVPFKTLLNTSDAIKKCDISAKYTQNDIKTKHSNEKSAQNGEEFTKGDTFHVNGVNRHISGNFYSEDNPKDISDTFEW